MLSVIFCPGMGSIFSLHPNPDPNSNTNHNHNPVTRTDNGRKQI